MPTLLRLLPLALIVALLLFRGNPRAAAEVVEALDIDQSMGPQHDDITLVTARLLPPGEKAG